MKSAIFKNIKTIVSVVVLMLSAASCVSVPREYVGKWTYAEQISNGRIVYTYELRDDGTFDLLKHTTSSAMRGYDVGIGGEWRIEDCDDKQVLTFKYDLDSFSCSSEKKTAEEREIFEHWNSDCNNADEQGLVYGLPVIRQKGSTLLVGQRGKTLRLTRLRH